MTESVEFIERRGETKPRLVLLFAMVIFVIAAALYAQRQRTEECLAIYPADRAYVDLAVAQQWATTGAPRAGVARVPLQVDSLWQALLAAGIKMGSRPASLPIFLSLTAGLLALLGVQRLARAVWPHVTFHGWVVAAWLLIGPVPLDVFSGHSFVLATALATFGWISHLRGLRSDRAALPLAAAGWIALACLVRIEFAAVWLTMGLHALLLSSLRRIETAPMTTLVRWLNGVVLLAIALCPVLWWNMQVLRVPWPPAPGALLTLNAVSGSGTSVLGAMGPGLHAAAIALGQGPFIGNGFIRLFALAGVVCVAIDVARRRLDYAATIVLAGLLLPVAYAPFYPFLGAEAMGHLQRAFSPLGCLSAGYAVARGAAAVELIGRRAHLAQGSRAMAIGSAVLLGAIPILAGLRDQIVAARAHAKAQQEALAARAAFSSSWSAAASEAGAIATDAPGWLLYSGQPEVIDLGGRLDPLLLGWIGGDAVRDVAGFRAYLSQRGVRSAVFWNAPSPSLAAVFNCPPPTTRAPMICAFTSRADF